MQSLYIPFDELRGNNNTVNRLASTIRTSNEFTTQILCGHKGSGKSTELMKLKQELESSDPKFFIVYCERRSEKPIPYEFVYLNGGWVLFGAMRWSKI